MATTTKTKAPEKMVTVKIEGSELEIPESTCKTDSGLRQALTPFYPGAANSTVERKTTNGKTIITVTKKAGNKGGRRYYVPGMRFCLHGLVDHLVTTVDPRGGIALMTVDEHGREHFFRIEDLADATEAPSPPVHSKPDVIKRAREFKFEARYSGRDKKWYFAPYNHLFAMSLDALRSDLKASGVSV